MKDEAEVTAQDRSLLDRAADLVTYDDRFAEREAFYRSTSGFAPDGMVHHYDYISNVGWREVRWQDA